VKYINTNTKCSGITSTNGMLVFSAIGKGLRKLDLKDEHIVDLVAFDANLWSRTDLCVNVQYMVPLISQHTSLLGIEPV
jgi:hypothetical protein